jgi:hypothetical protein
MSWAYILVLYAIWRWVKDNIWVREQKLKKAAEGTNQPVTVQRTQTEAWSEWNDY